MGLCQRDDGQRNLCTRGRAEIEEFAHCSIETYAEIVSSETVPTIEDNSTTGQCSGFACELTRSILAGCETCSDEVVSSTTKVDLTWIYETERVSGVRGIVVCGDGCACSKFVPAANASDRKGSGWT